MIIGNWEWKSDKRQIGEVCVLVFEAYTTVSQVLTWGLGGACFGTTEASPKTVPRKVDTALPIPRQQFYFARHLEISLANRPNA